MDETAAADDHRPKSSQGETDQQSLLSTRPHDGQPRRRRKHLQRVYRAFLKQSGLGFLWSLFWVKQEEPKIIVDRGILLVLARTAFHFVSLSMTVVLSYLQVWGFYIGGTLEGWHNENSEAFKQLLLQVAAKILEIIVIGSLTTVVVDVVRSYLIDSSIPLGWAAAHIQFANPLWFTSEGFWASIKGFRSKPQFFAVALFLITCGFIALLTGPATAVLLVPNWRSDWSAGGTDYWLASSPSVLWPTSLDVNTVGGQACLAPSSNAVVTMLINFSGCIWAGYNGLRGDYRDAHQTQVFNVTLNDGLQQRLLQRVMHNTPEVFTVAPHAAVTNPTFNFGSGWTQAISSIRGVSSEAHYQRNTGGTTFQIEAQAPIVRALCNEYINFTIPTDYVEYPYLPLDGSAPDVFYRLPKEPFMASPIPAASWIVPNETYQLNNGSSASVNPSAFINLQIPAAGNFSNFGAFMACSVDARWINTTHVGTQFDFTALGSYFVYAQIPAPYLEPFPKGRFPYTEKNVKVSMDSAWLDTLTPPIIPPDIPDYNTSTPGYNTIADILRAMRLDDGFTVLLPRKNQIESVVATVVADGMSRIGYTENGGSVTLAAFQNQVVGRYGISFLPESDWGKSVYKGGANTGFPLGYDASNSTYLRFNIFIQGFSFKADSPTYWLALTLFYVHAAIVVGHLCYRTFFRRESSVTWEGVTDLLALALVSDPPRGEGADALENACGGIDSFQTLAVNVAVRVAEPEESRFSVAGEQVKMFVGSEIRKRDVRKVEPGRYYGAFK